VALDFADRAQDFLKRITPLSADLAARTRTRTLQKLHRICQAEVRRYSLATVKLALYCACPSEECSGDFSAF
jgi:hypothetical protein